ncbi:Kinase, NEK [Giardia duodenalis ATCC 50581]|uniref:non-specific serine/threonine protein kinase n=1 Tax=Giardia intestinalis (strain ATCC 50581 / GS clone H7) TaxID=598745 RepID=C6LZ86_GIAIB|nr:Kinase, NEK [Giardia intestinalis ATCC 50581]
MSGEKKEIIASSTAVNALIDKMGQQLGQGIYGTVFSITEDNSKVIKEVSITDLQDSDVKAFETGILTLMKLSHTNLIKYDCAYKSDNAIYIIMTRCASSLDSVLKAYKRSNKSFSTEQVVNVAKQIGSALKYLHNPKENLKEPQLQRIVHGDIKLANILVNKCETEFILSDLGFGDKNTMTALMYCIAPEVLLGGDLTPAADMWSLGIVLHELSSGLKPQFLGNNQPKYVYVDGWKPNLSAVKDVTIKGILEHILVLDPSERLTASELLQILDSTDGSSTIANMLEIRTLKRRLEKMEARVGKLEALLAGAEVLRASHPECPNESSPLIDAVLRDDVEAVAALVESGAYNRMVDSNGMTAMMHAAERGVVGLVISLIECENGLQNRSGYSAMMLAARNGYDNIVGLLLEYEHGLKTNDGKTAKQLAQEAGHQDVVNILSEFSDE